MTVRHDSQEFLCLPHAQVFRYSELGLGTCRLNGQERVQLSTQGKSCMTVYICSTQRRINNEQMGCVVSRRCAQKTTV